MTHKIEKTTITDAASQDADLGNTRLEWSQPTLLRNGIESVTHSGIQASSFEATSYNPS